VLDHHSHHFDAEDQRNKENLKHKRQVHVRHERLHRADRT
jgi:hypothetical protein